MKLLIIGGSDAGISAALRARESAPDVDITMVLADQYPNFSICGLPFFLSGEVPNWSRLAHRSRAEIESHGITVLTERVAEAIETRSNAVHVRYRGGLQVLAYDKLIVATGATPVRPPIAGLEIAGVYILHTMDDSFFLNERLLTARSAVIIGAGYIGVEMADALTHRGIAVTLVERFPCVLTTVDPEFGDLIEAELNRHGVMVRTNTSVNAIVRTDGGVRVSGTDGFDQAADLALVVVGVRPNVVVAEAAGAMLGFADALRVTPAMATSLPDIYAAGDCVETRHRLLKRNVYLPLGTTAHKQGRVAGENAVGGSATFKGVVGTQAVKILSRVVAGTGLTEARAKDAGFDVRVTENVTPDHKAYYPGSSEMRVRVVGDASTGQLLGAQILGAWGSEVAKRIDVFATALYYGMRVEELTDLDLSYTPPLSSPWDPIQMAAQAWTAAGQSARSENATRR